MAFRRCHVRIPITVTSIDDWSGSYNTVDIADLISIPSGATAAVFMVSNESSSNTGYAFRHTGGGANWIGQTSGIAGNRYHTLWADITNSTVFDFFVETNTTNIRYYIIGFASDVTIYLPQNRIADTVSTNQWSTRTISALPTGTTAALVNLNGSASGSNKSRPTGGTLEIPHFGALWIKVNASKQYDVYTSSSSTAVCGYSTGDSISFPTGTLPSESLTDGVHDSNTWRTSGITAPGKSLIGISTDIAGATQFLRTKGTKFVERNSTNTGLYQNAVVSPDENGEFEYYLNSTYTSGTWYAAYYITGVLGSASELDPQYIAGAVQWYDAADTSTLTLSGSAVTAWNAKGVDGTAYLDTIFGANPTSGTRTINGKNAVEFANSGAIYRSALTPEYDANYTLAGVFVPDIVNASNRVATSRSISDDGFGVSVSATVQLTGPSGGVLATPTLVAGNTYRVIVCFADGTTRVWINGVKENIAGITNDRLRALSIGGESNGAGYFDGAIGEVIVYDYAIIDEDAELLDQILAAKWVPSAGLSITSIVPSQIDDGESFTINGTGFGASQGLSLVQIGGVTQPVTSWGPSQIVCTATRGSQSMGNATLTIYKM